jgi:hypothetical protein
VPQQAFAHQKPSHTMANHLLDVFWRAYAGFGDQDVAVFVDKLE